jgi:hypothetical protein
MQTTLKRIDVGSAFRVGMIVTGLLFAIFGILFVGIQAILLTGIASLSEDASASSATGVTAFLGVGVLGLLCFYGIGVVVGAIFGGIQFAIGAFCYNLAANWVGGVKVELETGDAGLLEEIERDLPKRKRDEL